MLVLLPVHHTSQAYCPGHIILYHNICSVLSTACRPQTPVNGVRTSVWRFLNVSVQVNFMSSFNSSSFPDSLALSKEASMSIGSIDEIQKLHIRTVPLGEQPRRLAHQEPSRTFALLTSPTQGPTGACFLYLPPTPALALFALF